MITDYSKKKLVEYLKDGQKVLIRFGHGLGDTLLFMPIFEMLKVMYPKIQFDLYVESGQEEIFKSIKNKDDPNYDLVFHLDFPMSEGSDVPKPAYCCESEIGIPPIVDVAKLPSFRSPIVAVHFQGTALPGSVSCPENIAKQVWNEIIEAGFIPLEVHFQHVFHNPINKKFEFVSSSVRETRPKISNLIGLIQHSHAFIGVASGPFIVALSCIPGRTFFLEKNHKLHSYTEKDIAKASVNEYQPETILTWLKNLK